MLNHTEFLYTELIREAYSRATLHIWEKARELSTPTKRLSMYYKAYQAVEKLAEATLII